jgi:hypothetical protein
LMAMECLTEDTGQWMKFCYWLCIDLQFWGQLLDSCYED